MTRLMVVTLAALVFAVVVYMFIRKEAFAEVDVVEDKKAVVQMPPRVYDATILGDPTYFEVRRGGTSDVTCCNLVNYKPRGNYLVACTDDEYIALFLAKPSGAHDNHIATLAAEDIGYLWEEDLEVLRKLFTMFSIKHIGTFVRVSSVEFSSVGCIFLLANTRAVPISRLNMVSVFVYNDITPAMVSKHLPYARVKQLQTSLYVPGYVGPDEVLTLVAFPNVLYTSTKEVSENMDMCAKAFVENLPSVEVLRAHFRLHPVAYMYIGFWHANTSSGQHNYMNLIEPYTDVVTLDAQENVPGFIDAKTKTFEMDGDSIGGKPLVVGDNVVMQRQKEAEENGAYIVVDFREDGGASLERRHPEDTPGHEPEEDDTYYCVTSPNLVYKHECLSPINPLTGDFKHQMDVWDAPCKFSSQCPFYKYDDHKGAYVGQCVDGACEMPPGYTRVGFRKYINQ